MSEYSQRLVREREAAEPALVAALAAEGYRFEAVLVVRMMDDREDARWWQRQHSELGYIVTPMDGVTPMDREGLHAFAVAEFGSDCALIY